MSQLNPQYVLNVTVVARLIKWSWHHGWQYHRERKLILPLFNLPMKIKQQIVAIVAFISIEIVLRRLTTTCNPVNILFSNQTNIYITVLSACLGIQVDLPLYFLACPVTLLVNVHVQFYALVNFGLWWPLLWPHDNKFLYLLMIIDN